MRAERRRFPIYDADFRVVLPTHRRWLAAGFIPSDPRVWLAFIEAIEADHDYHTSAGTKDHDAAWRRRQRAFEVFEYAEAEGFATTARRAT